MENKCGTCTLCCKLLGIGELGKPPNAWCKLCAAGKGCTSYDSKPQSCSEYACLWLISQTADGIRPLEPELRPDKTKCVISLSQSNDEVVSVHVDPGYPAAWRKPPIYNLLVRIAGSGTRVVIGQGMDRKRILLRRNTAGMVEKTAITMSAPDENGVQWYTPNGERV